MFLKDMNRLARDINILPVFLKDMNRLARDINILPVFLKDMNRLARDINILLSEGSFRVSQRHEPLGSGY